jgi:hypothetical protein
LSLLSLLKLSNLLQLLHLLGAWSTWVLSCLLLHLQLDAAGLSLSLALCLLRLHPALILHVSQLLHLCLV